MAQITCRNLSFAYDGETVLSDIEFSLDAGAYLCIVGENGSGKSTLMRGILGLKQPSKGEIVFDDLKPTEIGYLPQQTQMLLDHYAEVLRAPERLVRINDLQHTKRDAAESGVLFKCYHSTAS